MMKLCRSGAGRELGHSRLAPLLQNIMRCFTLTHMAVQPHQKHETALQMRLPAAFKAA